LPCIIILRATIIASVSRATLQLNEAGGRIGLAAGEHLRDELRRPPRRQRLRLRAMRD
jgi:hypothetical protein